MTIACTIYRCARQAEMYLYLRSDLKPEELPEALRKQAGTLTQVMELPLTPQRRLARVEVSAVIARLQSDGWYLQLPPNGAMHGHLHFGD
jgi:uncharacterized protein YcgL (UPF0745 family)